MKVAIVGKGASGKTTVAAIVARTLAAPQLAGYVLVILAVLAFVAWPRLMRTREAGPAGA